MHPSSISCHVASKSPVNHGSATSRDVYKRQVEKGVRLAAEKGVLAGYPVVGLKATLLDGSYHPVDSSEMAFIMAAKPVSYTHLLGHRCLVNF